jgi:hypothetical protein
VFRPNLHSRRAAVFVRNVTEGLDRPIDPIYIPGGLLSFVCYVTERVDRLLRPNLHSRRAAVFVRMATYRWDKAYSAGQV